MKRKIIVVVVLLLVIALAGFAETDIRLVVDGVDITEVASPLVRNDRVMVPIHFVAQEIGADINWDGQNRTVDIKRHNRHMKLYVDSLLVAYDEGMTYQVADVAPVIIGDRTYVPLKFISDGLGLDIDWDGDARVVSIETNRIQERQVKSDLEMTNVSAGGTIYGSVGINFNSSLDYDMVKLFLLDPDSGKGFVVAQSKEERSSLNYLPKVSENGDKLMGLVAYKDGACVGGHVLPISVDVQPSVYLGGFDDGDQLTSLTMSQSMNFLSPYVTYELENIKTGKIIRIEKRDPEGSYTWTPTYEEAGTYLISLKAYDDLGGYYTSAVKQVTFDVKRSLSLSGVKTGSTLKKPVTLMAKRNFDVVKTQYFVDGKLLAEMPYGSYKWFPDENYTGSRAIHVEVTDTSGLVHTSKPVYVYVDGSPKVFLKGVGPKQVLTKNATLSVESNVAYDQVTYVLANQNTGQVVKMSQSSTLDYSALDSGPVTLYAEVQYRGESIKSDRVSFTIYKGNLYGPKPIVAKSEFLDLISGLAIASRNETGMAASLQAAQAILETGWGQKLPVDKYSGKFSYNLFGIKGTGTNGSVISNTWEVFNGVTYRVDANFRAYNNIQEGWDGHKGILLNLSRYSQFRQVMYDGYLGAWAVKRAGYATDPKYPIKLIDIMNKYDLHDLDLVSID